MLLPFKVLLRGCLHVAIPTISAPGNDKITINTNEKLLDHDDLDFFALWLPHIAHTRLESIWLTTEMGLVMIHHPVMEYGLRILRAIRRDQVGFVNDKKIQWHVNFFMAFCKFFPVGQNTLVTNLETMMTTTGNLDGMVTDYFQECEDVWAHFSSLYQILQVFWGFTIPVVTDDAGLEPMGNKDPTHHANIFEMLPLSSSSLTAFLQRCYTETLLEYHLPNSDFLKYCTALNLQPLKTAPAITKNIFVDRHIIEDLQLIIKPTSHTAWDRVRFLMGLYLFLGNGFTYRNI